MSTASGNYDITNLSAMLLPLKLAINSPNPNDNIYTDRGKVQHCCCCYYYCCYYYYLFILQTNFQLR